MKLTQLERERQKGRDLMEETVRNTDTITYKQIDRWMDSFCTSPIGPLAGQVGLCDAICTSVDTVDLSPRLPSTYLPNRVSSLSSKVN